MGKIGWTITPQWNIEIESGKIFTLSGYPNLVEKALAQMERQLSLALNRVLRHELDNLQIPYDEEGYTRIDNILKTWPIKKLRASYEDVVKIVEVYQYTENKARFQMRGQGGDREVRSTEAHSLNYISLTEAHVRVELADMKDVVVYHGTKQRHLNNMMVEGVGPAPGKSGHTRNTVFYDAYKFAEPNSKYEYYVAVNMRLAICDGHSFYQTERGRYVSDEAIMPLYFEGTLTKYDFFNMTQEVYDSWNNLAWARSEAWHRYKSEFNSSASSSRDGYAIIKRQKVDEEKDYEKEENPWSE